MKTFAYTLKVEQDGPKVKTIEIAKYETKEEAKKGIRALCKKYDLKRQMGFWGNPYNKIEMFSNF